ncbi:MAG: aminoacyl-histidine dipeptidase [Chloroflexi bacterium]|nr:aminoacyl-histidine dipeptidase [Chloroflexota bacterium]
MNPTDLILRKFEQVSSIPRGTRYEAQIRQWLIDWGGALSLKSRTDAAGNLVIYVPASTGYEDHPALILQGHLDMVWQQTPESHHDFTRDPIQLIHDGDWIRANGTTLGADNGIAIALMMALVEDELVQHPPLEFLLTIEEEMGVVGADNLDASLLKGKTLINLDSEEEGVFTVGCAGGGSVTITLPVNWSSQSPEEIAFEVKVTGLQGGHSGEDINKQRANANKIITRVLDFIQRNVDIRLSTLKGGTARNAIPRDAEAIFVCSKDKVELCCGKFSIIVQDIQTEHARSEPRLSITLTEKGGEPVRAISRSETVNGLRLLISLPHGVSAMSAEFPGFVETSNNIGILELKEDGLSIVSNHRSSVLSRLDEITNRVESVGWLAGADTERTKIFPPWQPNMDSPLLKKCVETYRSVIEEEAKVQLSHGGLECGIISDRCGGLDTISMGPTIQNPHSPDEKLYIPSLAKIWHYLKALLAM